MDHLFVYGTLAPGEENHHIMEHMAGSWHPAVAKGEVQKQTVGDHSGYPCFNPNKVDKTVNGMLFSSTELDSIWSYLDAFEGAAYKRITIQVITESGSELTAYVYADLKSL